jgi:hypothetical protein
LNLTGHPIYARQRVHGQKDRGTYSGHVCIEQTLQSMFKNYLF